MDLAGIKELEPSPGFQAGLGKGCRASGEESEKLKPGWGFPEKLVCSARLNWGKEGWQAPQNTTRPAPEVITQRNK